MRIAIFGLGYVGTVAAACLARDGHMVTGVDPNPEKLNAIRKGQSPIVEPGLQDITAAAVKAGKLTVEQDARTAVLNNDVSIVCVGTPSLPTGHLDTGFLRSAVREIGMALAEKTEHHTVIIRSTTLPGTVEGEVLPLLEQESGKKAGINFGLGYFPEFLREGSAIADYDEPGTIVFAHSDPQTRSVLHALNQHAKNTDFHEVAIRVAEAIKYLNNAWHAAKISFANEFGIILKTLGVDSHDAFKVLCADKKLNISPAYMKPAFAFGGSCLPKDMRAIRAAARANNRETPFIDAVFSSNANQIRYAYEMIEHTGKRRVSLLGISFKPDTDDLRYSPYVELAEMLLGKGYELKIFDKNILLSRLLGANKNYAMSKLPHLDRLLSHTEEEFLSHAEVLVIGDVKQAAQLREKITASNAQIIDLGRLRDLELHPRGYQGICW